jgi:glycosyltransferase involved in cell wall biosynthesis
MTSLFEGISLTTIEAMACNIPVILYDVPGLRDFNKEKECAILIKEDFTRLAESIIYLHNNKEKQKELAVNTKQLLDSSYNMEINVSKIFALYQRH